MPHPKLSLPLREFRVWSFGSRKDLRNLRSDSAGDARDSDRVLQSRADVLKIVINDTIQPVTDEFIGRALTEAKNSHADALLIEIDTPGGLVDSTREIIEKIVDSSVPVIVYVTPSGSRAASAGFFILESADIAAMAPGTNTGAAHPVHPRRRQNGPMS